MDNENTFTSTSKNVHKKMLEVTGKDERVIAKALLQRSVSITEELLANMDDTSKKQQYLDFLEYAQAQILRFS